MSDTQILPNPPTAMLKAVHERMKELFARYDTLGPEAGWAKKGLYHVLEELLHIHMEIEEVLFYPAVESMKSELAISVVLRALKVHRQLKALLEELKALSLESKSLDSKMAELQACVLPHLLMEEREIFPHARAMPLETLHELSGEMEKLRVRLRESRGILGRLPGDQNPY
jgi:hypothetical protein